MARTQVSIDELYSILDTEYRRARSPACKACVTPFPMRCRPPDDVSTNWFITTPDNCPNDCIRTLGEIVARLMSEYELERSVFGTKR
jgi:hypothetical protein